MIGVDRALDERMRDGRRAVEPVLGEGGLEDDFGRLAGERDEHALGEGFRRWRDRLAAAVAPAREKLRAEAGGGGVPVGLAGKHVGGVGGREARDMDEAARDQPGERGVSARWRKAARRAAAAPSPIAS